MDGNHTMFRSMTSLQHLSLPDQELVIILYWIHMFLCCLWFLFHPLVNLHVYFDSLNENHFLHFSFWFMFFHLCWDLALCRCPWPQVLVWDFLGFALFWPLLGEFLRYLLNWFRGRFRVWCLGHRGHHARPLLWSWDFEDDPTVLGILDQLDRPTSDLAGGIVFHCFGWRLLASRQILNRGLPCDQCLKR